ncbi:sulfotransferase family 2 domain-containing protein [Fulvimonas yonginensis]|uniref:Sulfotransferase family 2 domain-containing protein n=1 Tax=Fulvimonas yonginensis TaxID=1495200 RepID=A0ABU8J9I6_9GAMM
MIISHKHRFIFLKTNKTAGTSIEIALSKFCGPEDVITPISPADEEIRRGLGYPGPQNYMAPWRDYGLRDLALLVLKGHRKMRYFNHISGREVRELVGAKVWNSYYKFCFERNPYDRVISHYYWCNRTEPRPPLSSFIHSPKALALKRRGYGVYTIDGEVAVDRICRYEAIAEELEEVRKVIGLPEPLELPRAKSKTRADNRSYREVLGEEERSWIARTFGEEMRLMGYRFLLPIWCCVSVSLPWLQDMLSDLLTDA